MHLGVLTERGEHASSLGLEEGDDPRIRHGSGPRHRTRRLERLSLALSDHQNRFLRPDGNPPVRCRPPVDLVDAPYRRGNVFGWIEPVRRAVGSAEEYRWSIDGQSRLQPWQANVTSPSDERRVGGGSQLGTTSPQREHQKARLGEPITDHEAFCSEYRIGRGLPFRSATGDGRQCRHQSRGCQSTCVPARRAAGHRPSNETCGASPHRRSS